MSSRGTLRQSGRLTANENIRVLDKATRQRRLRKQLDLLEQDNFHEDPHAQLQWHKKIPKFDEEKVRVSGSNRKKANDNEHGDSGRKRKKLRAEHSKQRFRKNFMALMEEETLSKSPGIRGRDAYLNAQATPSKLPPRHFCAACGFFSKYNCSRCGAKYCSIKCRDLHEDTRCLKWTV